MRYVLAELQLNKVRYMKSVKDCRYTTRLEDAQKLGYREAHDYAGALCHLGFDFTAMPLDVAERLDGMWYVR